MTRLILTSTCAAALMALSLSAGAQTPPEAAVVAQVPSVAAPAAQPEAAPLNTESQAQPVAPVAAEPAPTAEAPAAAAPAQSQSEAPAAAAPTTAPPATATPEAATPEATPAEAPTGTAAPVDAPTGVTAEAPAAPAPEGAAAEASLPKAHDMTPMGMYNQADAVVKSVMIILAAACFVTWTIWLFKLIETAVARRRARSAARTLTSAQSLESAVQALARRRDPAAFMAQAVHAEFQRSDAAIDPAGPEGVKERAVSLVNRVEVQAAARMRRGMGILATVGSVSPFVGLLGTVWGIMNSFIGIAETQTTNLAVVAPGIAEALFATAIGLVAAIPAVVIYNGFTRSIAGYKQSLGDAGAAALRLLSRDIDFRHVKGR